MKHYSSHTKGSKAGERWRGWLRATVLFAALAARVPVHAAGLEADAAWLRALQHRDLATVSALLEQGADPNQATAESKTALMFAAQAGDLALARRLLERGARVDIRNSNQGTALMYAAMCNEPEMTRLLIRHGAGVNDQARLGWTALLVASVKGNDATAAALLEAGARVNAPDAYGWTPLMRAAHTARENIVRLLLTRPELDLSVRERGGATALHVAASLGHLQIVELLLRAGADPRALDGQEHTPAELAEAAGADEVSALLATFAAGPGG